MVPGAGLRLRCGKWHKGPRSFATNESKASQTTSLTAPHSLTLCECMRLVVDEGMWNSKNCAASGFLAWNIDVYTQSRNGAFASALATFFFIRQLSFFVSVALYRSRGFSQLGIYGAIIQSSQTVRQFVTSAENRFIVFPHLIWRGDRQQSYTKCDIVTKSGQ